MIVNKFIELPDGWAVIKHKENSEEGWWAVRHLCAEDSKCEGWDKGTNTAPWFGTCFSFESERNACIGCATCFPETIGGFINLLEWSIENEN